jgi:hypothetical protein
MFRILLVFALLSLAGCTGELRDEDVNRRPVLDPVTAPVDLSPRGDREIKVDVNRPSGVGVNVETPADKR